MFNPPVNGAIGYQRGLGRSAKGFDDLALREMPFKRLWNAPAVDQITVPGVFFTCFTTMPGMATPCNADTGEDTVSTQGMILSSRINTLEVIFWCR